MDWLGTLFPKIAEGRVRLEALKIEKERADLANKAAKLALTTAEKTNEYRTARPWTQGMDDGLVGKIALLEAANPSLFRDKQGNRDVTNLPWTKGSGGPQYAPPAPSPEFQSLAYELMGRSPKETAEAAIYQNVAERLKPPAAGAPAAPSTPGVAPAPSPQGVPNLLADMIMRGMMNKSFGVPLPEQGLARSMSVPGKKGPHSVPYTKDPAGGFQYDFQSAQPEYSTPSLDKFSEGGRLYERQVVDGMEVPGTRRELGLDPQSPGAKVAEQNALLPGKVREAATVQAATLPGDVAKAEATKRVTEKAGTEVSGAEAARGSLVLIGNLKEQWRKLHRPGGPLERIRMMPQQQAQVYLQTDPELSAYEALVAGAMPKIARDVLGQTGALTDTDIREARKTVPGFNTTDPVGLLMWGNLEKLAKGKDPTVRPPPAPAPGGKRKPLSSFQR